MTPKEKAEQLVYKMKFPKAFPDNISWARECATEAVNEMIQLTIKLNTPESLDTIKFYEMVLMEIPDVQ